MSASISDLKLKFYFRYDCVNDSVAMYLIGEDAVGRKYLAKPMPVEFEPRDPSKIGEPTWEINGMSSRGFLEALANGLAEAGYRHESTDAGELKATKYHLEDMRLIAQAQVRAKSKPEGAA